MTKHWMRWTLASLALTFAATLGFACEDHAKNDDTKNAKDDAAAVAKADTKGCTMPCCAHDNDAADAKNAAAAPAEMPCSGHDGKGCPKKKAAAVAKADTKAQPKAEPSAGAGTQR